MRPYKHSGICWRLTARFVFFSKHLARPYKRFGILELLGSVSFDMGYVVPADGICGWSAPCRSTCRKSIFAPGWPTRAPRLRTGNILVCLCKSFYGFVSCMKIFGYLVVILPSWCVFLEQGDRQESTAEALTDGISIVRWK